MIKVLIIIFIILGALFLIGGGYFLGVSFPMGESQSPSPSAVVMPTPSIETSVSPSPAASYQPSDQTTDGSQLGDVLGPDDAQRAISGAIESNNFDKIEPNLGSKVMLIVYATSCCGESSDPKEIVDFISGYAKKGDKPWVFNSPDDKYSGLKESSDFYAVDKTGRALAFKLNEDNKLKSITFYGDYRLAGN